MSCGTLGVAFVVAFCIASANATLWDGQWGPRAASVRDHVIATAAAEETHAPTTNSGGTAVVFSSSPVLVSGISGRAGARAGSGTNASIVATPSPTLASVISASANGGVSANESTSVNGSADGGLERVNRVLEQVEGALGLGSANESANGTAAKGNVNQSAQAPPPDNTASNAIAKDGASASDDASRIVGGLMVTGLDPRKEGLTHFIHPPYFFASNDKDMVVADPTSNTLVIFGLNAGGEGYPCMSPMWTDNDPACNNAFGYQLENSSMQAAWFVTEKCEVACPAGKSHLVPTVNQMRCERGPLLNDSPLEISCRCCQWWVFALIIVSVLCPFSFLVCVFAIRRRWPSRRMTQITAAIADAKVSSGVPAPAAPNALEVNYGVLQDLFAPLPAPKAGSAEESLPLGISGDGSRAPGSGGSSGDGMIVVSMHGPSAVGSGRGSSGEGTFVVPIDAPRAVSGGSGDGEFVMSIGAGGSGGSGGPSVHRSYQEYLESRLRSGELTTDLVDVLVAARLKGKMRKMAQRRPMPRVHDSALQDVGFLEDFMDAEMDIDALPEHQAHHVKPPTPEEIAEQQRRERLRVERERADADRRAAARAKAALMLGEGQIKSLGLRTSDGEDAKGTQEGDEDYDRNYFDPEDHKT